MTCIVLFCSYAYIWLYCNFCVIFIYLPKMALLQYDHNWGKNYSTFAGNIFFNRFAIWIPCKVYNTCCILTHGYGFTLSFIAQITLWILFTYNVKIQILYMLYKQFITIRIIKILRKYFTQIEDDPDLLPNVSLVLKWNDTHGETVHATKTITEMICKKVAVFFGPEGNTCHTEAIVAQAWNIPMISYVSLPIWSINIITNYYHHIIVINFIVN